MWSCMQRLSMKNLTRVGLQAQNVMNAYGLAGLKSLSDLAILAPTLGCLETCSSEVSGGKHCSHFKVLIRYHEDCMLSYISDATPF